MNEKTEFYYYRRHNDKVLPIFGLIILLSIVIMVVNLSIGAIILIIAVVLSQLYQLCFNRMSKGVFFFHMDGVEILTAGKKEFIAYSDIKYVVRECYHVTKQAWLINYTQPNPNQYRIETRQRNYIFCVSKSEERALERKVHQLNKKIYGINHLGMSLRTKPDQVDQTSPPTADSIYEQELPSSNYSLSQSIELLIDKGNLAFNDLTA